MTDTDMWQPLLQSMDETMALYRRMLEMSEQKKNVLVQGKPGIIAPDGVGKYYFEVRYGEAKIGLAVKQGVIPEEFMELSRKIHAETITDAEKIRLQEVKEIMAAEIIVSPPEKLFDTYLG